MSTEQNDNPTEWVMPEPVFRTSEGRTPGLGKAPDDDVDTLETEMGAEGPAHEWSEGMDEAAGTPAGPDVHKKKGGCFRTLLIILGVIALLAVIVTCVVIYFLSSLTAPETGNF